MDALFLRKNYLNCVKIELVEHLIHHGEAFYQLFYNSYENTNKIYENIIVQNKGFWNYPSESLNNEDLFETGILAIPCEVQDRYQTEAFIRSNLQQGNILFFGIEPRCLPGFDLLAPDSKHSVMIEEWNESEDTYKLNDASKFVGKWIDRGRILDIMEELNSPLFAVDFKKFHVSDNVRKTYQERAEERIKRHADDFSFYQSFIDSIADFKNKSITEMEESLGAWRQAFQIIAGSRYNFSRYVQHLHSASSVSSHLYLSDLILHCSDLAESIKNSLLKQELLLKMYPENVLFDDIVVKSLILKDFEILTLKRIKKFFAPNDSSEDFPTFNIKLSNPQKITLLDKKPSSATLTWNGSPKEQFVIAYELSVNNQICTTKVPYFTLRDLKPGTTYEINIKAINAYGEKSIPGTDISITTETYGIDLDKALYRPTTASSYEDDNLDQNYQPSNAVDGNANTRWSSLYSEPQWISVDMGAITDIESVTLRWEGAYAKAYRLQVSTDGHTWSDIYENRTGSGGTEVIEAAGRGRFLRVNCLERATEYGFSLWQIAIKSRADSKAESETKIPADSKL
ncbi:discoidin domain-containing protein [Paenibacillus sp. FJAT-26967]|uniref:discoidin domain-containing protein n=1 Tax=Paenibacillus sp. FJAT-26967 TaxID=1729690 RepID=UPI00083891E8|nr:discoidin domain-containing protein [Paenibacillus sp. FJAT-26967]